MKENNDNLDSPENESISTINSDTKLIGNHEILEGLIKFIDNIINISLKIIKITDDPSNQPENFFKYLPDSIEIIYL